MCVYITASPSIVLSLPEIVHVHVCIHVHLYMYVYIYLHVCVHICICLMHQYSVYKLKMVSVI